MGWACFPWYIEREREREKQHYRSRSLLLPLGGGRRTARNPNPNRAAIRKACDDATSLRAAAMRILRPARFPGEGVCRLAEGTPQYRYKTALEQGYWRASQIKQMKEELYDLIAEDVANSLASKPDRLLLKRLCTQVEPRPNDPQWRKLTRNKKVLGYCVTTGFVVSSVLAVSGLTSHPKVVNYDGYLVTTESESVPMLQERLPKEAGYQSVATAGGMRKQEKMEKQMR